MEVRFSIADICISIESSDPNLALGTMQGRQDFVANGKSPDSIVSAEWSDSLQEISGEPIFNSGALWKLYSCNNQYHFSFMSPLLGSQPYKIASFNEDFSRCHISINRNCYRTDQVDPLEYPLDELLIVHLLSQKLGVEVHACGVIDSFRNGILFVGQSGAGKTTMAGLMKKQPQIKILSDDRIILRAENSKIWMYGTPWHGEARYAAPEKVELKKIFFLKQNLKNEALPLNQADAVARFFSCSFPLFYDSSAVDFMLSFFEETVSRVSAFELQFMNNDEIIEFINQSNRFEYAETVY
jgi:hypothetical protein